MHGGRGGKEPEAGATEGLQQGTVAKLSNDFGADVVGFEPGVDGAAQGIVASREQHRGTVEVLGECLAKLVAQGRAAEQRDTDVAQQVRIKLQIGALRRRPVGDDQIESVECQLAQQVFEVALDALQAELQRGLQHDFHQPKRNQLGHCIGDADREARPGVRVFGHSLKQLAADLENLLGIDQHGSAGLGQDQRSSLRSEQGLAELAFKQAELGADGLHRQAQSFPCARDAAFLGDRPEIQQVPVVKIVGFNF